MFSIDTQEIKNYEKDLKAFAAHAFPYATRQTLNNAAFAAQKTAKLNIKSSMVTRNKWTEQSVRVDRAQGLNIRTQMAVMGSISPYMVDQEFGGEKTKRGRVGVAIPTPYSSGEGMTAKPRTRLPRPMNRMPRIRLKRKRSGVNRKQKNLIAVKQAAASKNKHTYLNLGSRKGIFRVVGGKRKPMPRMMQNLSDPDVSIPKNPTIVPAAIATKPKMGRMYKRALEFQMKRHRLFR